jgi:hypothetical protein
MLSSMTPELFVYRTILLITTVSMSDKNMPIDAYLQYKSVSVVYCICDILVSQIDSD